MRCAIKTVTVVPTNSIVEGFAALLAYDPDASAEDNAQGHVRVGERTSWPAK
jgi:dihydroxyacetone kinase-like predicted kinase